MFKCVRCGKESDHLYANTREYNCYCFDGENYTTRDSYVSEIEFVCPKCFRVITVDEDEARQLLQGSMEKPIQTGVET